MDNFQSGMSAHESEAMFDLKLDKRREYKYTYL